MFVVIVFLVICADQTNGFPNPDKNSRTSTSPPKYKYEKTTYSVRLARAICVQTNFFAKSKKPHVERPLKDPLSFPELNDPSQSCNPTKHNVSFETENEGQQKVKFPTSVWIWEEDTTVNKCSVLALYKTIRLLRVSSRSYENPIKFYLFTMQHRDSRKRIKVGDDNLFSKSGYIPNARLIIISHGWGGDIENPETQCLLFMNAYFNENHNINIICVDWSDIAGSVSNPFSYPSASTNTYEVGQETARLVKYLFQKDIVKLDFVHAIGFSLGAHVVGAIGEGVKKILNDKIGRITGLDPSGYLFDSRTFIFSRRRALKSEDAKFVDVIHTSSCSIGSKKLTGHADFFPNGGRTQGGSCSLLPCILNACSHYRAYELYKESILNPSAFTSCKCSQYSENRGPSSCSCSHDEARMGEHVDHGSRGYFHVTTNADTPFSIF